MYKVAVKLNHFSGVVILLLYSFGLEMLFSNLAPV